MATPTEYSVQGVARAGTDGRILLNPAGTRYELDLAVEGGVTAPAGAMIGGTIRAKARKVWTVGAGGSFVTPIAGEPRVIQGRVKHADAARLVVHAGLNVTVELPQQPAAYDLVNGPVAVGSLVNITLLPGCAFEPLPPCTPPRSPGVTLSCVVGFLIGLQAWAAYAQEPAGPPPSDLAPAGAVAQSKDPATRPAKAPVARPPTTRPATKGTTPAAVADPKPPQPFRLTRTGKLDPKSPLGLAVEEIRREYERDALRPESSYFRETPCNDLTQDNLFILLDRKLGAAPSVDGYLKWQLLSSLPKSLPPQYKPLVIAALNKAPTPITMPGLIADEAQGQQMEREVARYKKDQGKAAMERLDAERERVQTLNVPILAYRSDLVSLLDKSYDGVLAAFGDAYHRGQAGAAYSSTLDGAVALANGWMKTNPPRDLLLRFADALAEMRDVKLSDMVAQFDWNEQRGGFTLRRDQRAFDLGGRIRTLEMDVRERLSADQNSGQYNRAGGRRRGR